MVASVALLEHDSNNSGDYLNIELDLDFTVFMAAPVIEFRWAYDSLLPHFSSLHTFSPFLSNSKPHFKSVIPSLNSENVKKRQHWKICIASNHLKWRDRRLKAACFAKTWSDTQMNKAATSFFKQPVRAEMFTQQLKYNIFPSPLPLESWRYWYSIHCTLQDLGSTLQPPYLFS